MAEHYGNTPRITYEFPDCSMPMAFDTYNNCSFGCMYCFAQNQRGIGRKKKEYLHKEVKDVSVERIKRMFIDPDKHGRDFAPYIKARKVMQWGSMSDQFDNFERKYGTTLELLRFFKDIDYPLCFSTKGAWFTKDERYMDLIRGQKNWNFKFSIITSDAEKARVIERGVESPQARLEAIERIANAGAGGATLRLRPFIIGVSTPTYLDLIKEAFNRGATALSTEFFCLETRSPTLRELLPTISKMAGFDILAFYKKYSVQSGYLRLNRKVKEPFFRNMKELCDQLITTSFEDRADFLNRQISLFRCLKPETVPAEWVVFRLLIIYRQVKDSSDTEHPAGSGIPRQAFLCHERIEVFKPRAVNLIVCKQSRFFLP